MSSHDDGLGVLIMGAMLASALIALVVFGIGIVIVILAGGLVVSVLKAQPKSIPVWISLSVFGLSLLLVLFLGIQSASLLFCLVSFVGVLVTCLVEKAIHPQLFDQTNKQPVVTDLIRNQWWDDDDDDDQQQQQQQRIV